MNTSKVVYSRVEGYLDSIIPRRDAVLTSIEKDAELHDVPIVGPVEASAISLIIKASHARRALEIGTATGYSGIWIARALEGKGKKLFTIEMDEKRTEIARKNFEHAHVSNIVEILAGNAKTIVPRIAKSQGESFDAVFLDIGEKTLYVSLLPHCLRMLRPGGILIADNTLWNGLVVDPDTPSAEAQTMRKYNKLIFSNKKLEAAIIPIRDGFTVARKKTIK